MTAPPTKRAAKASASFSQETYDRLFPESAQDTDSQISEFTVAYSTVEGKPDEPRLEIELSALPKIAFGFGLCFELTLRIHRCTDDTTDELFDCVIEQKHSASICQSEHPVALAMALTSPLWQKRLKGRDLESWRYLILALEKTHVQEEKKAIEGALSNAPPLRLPPKSSI